MSRTNGEKEALRATGPMAKANPFRFSTKYQDDEADLLYYGYRYCNASTGRWLSRNPIAENGGLPATNPHDGSGGTNQRSSNSMPRMPKTLKSECFIAIDAGHEWIAIDGQGYGCWPSGSALYSGGKMYKGNDPHTGERTGTNWRASCRRGSHARLRSGPDSGRQCGCASCAAIRGCIRAMADNWDNGAHHYCLPTQNCRDFVADALDRCGMYKDKWN